MPYLIRDVEREVFCEINGISIYHLYRNDDAEERLNFHFSTTPEEDDIPFHFDAREVAAELKQRDPNYVSPVSDSPQSDLEWTDAHKQQVIADALRLGLLPLPDEFDAWWKRQETGEQLRRYEVTNDLLDHDMPDG